MTESSRPVGTGPGVITPDGCAVDFYARMTASATMEYLDGDRVWTHAFTARRLDDAGLRAVLTGAGLRLDRYLTDDHGWLRAAPA